MFFFLFFIPDICMPLDRRFGKDGKSVTLSLFRLVIFFPCYIINLRHGSKTYLCELYLSLFTVLKVETEQLKKYIVPLKVKVVSSLCANINNIIMSNNYFPSQAI